VSTRASRTRRKPSEPARYPKGIRRAGPHRTGRACFLRAQRRSRELSWQKSESGRQTGRSFATDQEWVEWYFAGGGIQEYPEPDINRWYADLKEQVVIA